jgi:dolichol-phosphate mannosyltransferase
MKLSVISPTYNESENVGPLIATLEQALRGTDYEIITSDDDSPDLTWAHVEEIAKRNTRVRALRRTGNRGLGASVVDGFSLARGEVIACIDADLQHDPNILRKMLEELDRGADLVVATRYMPGGGTTNWSPIRRFASWTATQMARLLLGVPLLDPMSGYFMLRQKDFLRVRNELDGQGFKILLEIVARMGPRSLREVPYTFRPRVAGQSKLSAKFIVAYLRQLWWLYAARRRHPHFDAQFDHGSKVHACNRTTAPHI